MGILLDDATSQWLFTNSTPVTVAPFTVAAWFNTDTVALNEILVYIGDKDIDGDDRWFLMPSGADAGDYVSFRATDSGAGTAFSDTAYTANKWHLAVGVEAASNSRYAYRGDDPGAENTTEKTPDGADRVAIGAMGDPTPGSYWSGIIAEVAIWNVGLTASEIAALAGHVWPPLVRPAALVFYLPMYTKDDLIDLVGGRVMSVSAGPVATAEHPYIIRPTPEEVEEVTAAAGGAKPAMHYYRHLLS